MSSKAGTQKQFETISESMLIQLMEIARLRQHNYLPTFTSQEKIMLKLSWDQFCAGDHAKCGFNMFLRMFKNHPETQSVFSFAQGSSAAQMQGSARLLFHVTRVVKYICKVVDHLDNLEEVVPLLKELGGRHGTSGYNVNPKFFPFLGEAMRSMMKESVSTFNEKTNKAWQRLFDSFICEMITIGQKDYGHRH